MMLMRNLWILVFVGWVLPGCESREIEVDGIEPPVAMEVEKILSIHGDDRRDEYYWIRDDDRQDPAVLRLLAEENAYTRKMMAHLGGLQDELFDEISNRLVSDDRTVPVRTGSYYYYREYKPGGEYPVYLRSPVNDPDSPYVMLDANELSIGHDYYHIGGWSVSLDEKLLAYAEDTVSRREYVIKIKNLETGNLLEDKLVDVAPDIAWAADNRSLFYVAKDTETLLPYRVYHHLLGTSQDEDRLVYEETDDAFYTSVRASRSKKYIVITIESTDSTEVRLVSAAEPTRTPIIFQAREEAHEYRIQHVGSTFYILTNWRAENFRLMKVEEKFIGDKSRWQEMIPHRESVLLQDMAIFKNYIAINERINGLAQLRVLELNGESAIDADQGRIINFPDPAYTASLHSNPEVDTDTLRYVYSSLTTPQSDFEFDMETGQSTLLKEETVLGGFDRKRYTAERVSFESRDGTRVPVSLVYKTSLFKKGRNPIYVYAYGSYGYAIDPKFVSRRLSLLDRGFVYAMIHVRGGEDLGRPWYADGKMLNKKNTFNDFIDGSRFLVSQGYGDKDKVFAVGGSAGGLLMGVIANEAPEVYKGIVAHVPFVDVVTTMLDETIPLTSGEFNEWGNPRDKEYYDYMLSYSPYDQVKAQRYPNMLVTTGLHDSQVQYFEPVKWVSRLRRLKLDDNLLLMDINMETGHGGASGRYERHRLDALEYAFLLDLAGKTR